MKEAKAHSKATLIHINSDPLLYSPSGESWWDVPIPSVSTLDSTKAAYESYSKAVKAQKPLLGKGSTERRQGK
jgi:3D-(3,5/4)-trihydroxycyclohexane-1,2-dione acylhydrolase (decyclizing)